jgi:hypothetical protein
MYALFILTPRAFAVSHPPNQDSPVRHKSAGHPEGMIGGIATEAQTRPSSHF